MCKLYSNFVIHINNSREHSLNYCWFHFLHVNKWNLLCDYFNIWFFPKSRADSLIKPSIHTATTWPLSNLLIFSSSCNVFHIHCESVTFTKIRSPLIWYSPFMSSLSPLQLMKKVILKTWESISNHSTPYFLHNDLSIFII